MTNGTEEITEAQERAMEHFARIEELRLLFDKLGIELRAAHFTPVTWVIWSRMPQRTMGPVP